MAEKEAKQSLCDRSKVGAVLAHPMGNFYKARNIVEEGHSTQTCKNFCPRGRRSYIELPQDAPFTGLGACTATHAEMQAVKLAKESFLEVYDGLALRLGEDIVLIPESADADWRVVFEGFWMISTREPCPECRSVIDALGIIPIWTHSRFVTRKWRFNRGV
jgi:tRNA(Arg) A34 adenosine deaminase TadA